MKLNRKFHRKDKTRNSRITYRGIKKCLRKKYFGGLRQQLTNFFAQEKYSVEPETPIEQEFDIKNYYI